MKKSKFLFSLFLICFAANLFAQQYYLRGEASPCGWGNSSAGCQLTDPDNNGVYELTLNFGTIPQGKKEFKIYNATTDSWYPGGANAWFYFNGGNVTFRFNTANNQVEASEALPTAVTLCAPGAFSGWNNATPMTSIGGNFWCYTIPTPGTYEWKPTLCGTWSSWQPNNGERSMNSGNWSVTTTTPNEQLCVSYNPATGRVTPNNLPVGIYLRGSAGPCGWNNVAGGCELKDLDGDGCYEITVDLGSTPLGFQEFKIYNAATDTWYPTGANSWYNHQGGSVTFKYCTDTHEVEAHDSYLPSICAPGDFSGWNNAYPMTAYDNGTYCFTVPTPGTYQWKPTVCGTWNSWQSSNGERSVDPANWVVKTTQPNQQVCVTYDVATGRLFLGAANVPTMSEWGLFIFALLMSIIGFVTVAQRKQILAGTQNVGFSLQHIPFNGKLYGYAVLFTAVMMVAIFVVATTAFGYAMTTADIPGSIMATPLLAYLLMLFGQKQNQ